MYEMNIIACTCLNSYVGQRSHKNHEKTKLNNKFKNDIFFPFFFSLAIIG